MLEAIAWILVAAVSVPILSIMLFIFIGTFIGSFMEKQYDDLEEGYVVMPDGTIRFDYEEYI